MSTTNDEQFQSEMAAIRKRMQPQIDAEEREVRALGDRIGYGRLMQAAEKIWNELTPGGAHSVGPCVALLVPCPHTGYENAGECDWCCGAGRVTERVLKAMKRPA